MLALLIFGVFCNTIYVLCYSDTTSEEINEMLNSDEWY